MIDNLAPDGPDSRFVTLVFHNGKKVAIRKAEVEDALERFGSSIMTVLNGRAVPDEASQRTQKNS